MAQPFCIDRSETRAFKSAILNRDFNLYVYLPEDCDREARYPVLYALDGHTSFQILATIGDCLAADQFVPKLIIVGIAHAGEAADRQGLRERDFTPTPVANRPGSGGAAALLSCLKQELIPFVESNYPADAQNRALLGHSLSGLFCLYTLFHDRELFKGYISTSPSLWWDEGVLFDYEAALARQSKSLPVRLFLSVGELESDRMVEPLEKMVRILMGRDYDGLQLTARVVSGEGHLSTIPEAFTHGLRAVFAE